MADKEWEQTKRGVATLVTSLTPWLLELGSWIFGALIAFNLLILAALLTVGPVDSAVVAATAALALALPFDVAGLVLLRLVVDVGKARLDDVAVKAFEEAGFSAQQVEEEQNLEAVMKRRTTTVLVYCYSMLSLSALLTVVGVTAAFWHVRWWIGVGFLVVIGVSLVIVLAAFGGSPTRRRSKA
ncbi:MAG TPA: hypothetical protein VJQ08_09925 [Candidatus Dormibacteraeota bacterium]|nr:hypothetical protein [Candidatus Dormibacteraeota bacterium]